MGLAAATMVLLWVGGEGVTHVLRYDRQAILNGELWRLVTGHFVHANFRHMALNVAGGALMAALFLRTYSPRHWLLILAISLVVIDIGFFMRERELQDYVGFSGVLHGVLVAGMLAWWRLERPAMAAALTAIVVAKLAWEQWSGPLPIAGDELVVIVNAHLYGAIGGGVTGAVLIVRGKLPKPEPKSSGTAPT